ncbi:MAG: DUF1800 family protein [Blastocatellia bacterium]
MKSHSRLLALAVLVSLLAPLSVIAQGPPPPAPQAIEQFITRLRDGLKLSDEQLSQLRQVLSQHESKYLELRRRAQTNPYQPGLVPEVEKEQSAIRDEIAALLDEAQKAKLASLDVRLPVPLPPPFIVINIPPRAAAREAIPQATREPLIAVPPATARTARLSDDQKIIHLLNRATFGPRPGDVERLRQIGVARFLDEQLHPETIDDAELEKRLSVLPTLQMSAAEAYQFYPPPPVIEQRAKEKNPPPIFGRPQQLYGELVQQKLVRAVASNRQLQEVMTDFWFNHFNVFAQKEADQWFVSSYERDVIRPRALGKFRDLLLATAQSPAMLFYLDNWLSFATDAKEPRPPRPPAPANARPAPGANLAPTPAPAMPASQSASSEAPAMQTPPQANPAMPAAQAQPPRPPQRKRDINENYARELMELHTLGVEGGYTQKDVQEVARCLTGWTIDRPYQGGGFMFRPWMHDTGSKVVLGVTIPAGGGISDGLRVIDILARHPATARFISKKLCERFVSDQPPAPLVEHVAQVFLRSDGDIGEVLRAIFTSAEFNSPACFRAKVKSPLELAASAIRALDGDTNGGPPLHEWLRRMGEPLYQYAFPTGYGENSEKWMNTGVFFNRINFAVALANSQINGTRYDPARLIKATAGDDEAINQLAALLIHTPLTADSRRVVREALAQPMASPPQARSAASDGHQPAPVPASADSKNDPRARHLAQLIGLLLGTTEFQRK